MGEGSVGIAWPVNVHPRLPELVGLQKQALSGDMDPLGFNVDFQGYKIPIRLREICSEVKYTFLHGQCTLFAFALHEITGLPLVLIDDERFSRKSSWGGHAVVQVEDGVFLDVLGMRTYDDIASYYGGDLSDPDVVSRDEFLEIMFAVEDGVFHPLLYCGELEWLVVQDFVKHSIATTLIPYCENHDPALASQMKEKLAEQERKDALGVLPAPLPRALRLYSPNSGIPWRKAENPLIKELATKAIPFPSFSPYKIPLQFNGRVIEATLGHIDQSFTRFIDQGGWYFLTLAFHDILGMPIMRFDEKKPTPGTTRWYGYAAAQTADGQYIGIYGLQSEEKLLQQYAYLKHGGIDSRFDFVQRITKKADKHYPVGTLGELEWLVIQDFAIQIIRDIVIPHYEKNFPPAVNDAVNKLASHLRTYSQVSPAQLCNVPTENQ